MAIQLNLSKMDLKREALLDPANAVALERGMIMVYTANTASTGEQLVAPSTGAASEVFAGVLWLSETTQADVPVIELADVPSLAPLTITLTFTPIAFSNMLAIRTDTNAQVTVVAGAPGGGQLGLVGKVLTADAALAGVPLQLIYRYSISAAELARRGGRRSINQGAETLFNQVTLMYGNLRLMLSNFVTSDIFDVTSNKVVKMAANGKVGTSGVGATIGQCFQSPVMHLTPGIEQAFVGVEFKPPLV